MVGVLESQARNPCKWGTKQTSENRAVFLGAVIRAGGRRILWIGARGGGMDVTRATVSTTLLPSVHARRISKAVLLPRSRRARNHRINPSPPLLRELHLMWEVRRSRPPLGRPVRRNNPSPLLLKRGGNSRRPNRKAWWSGIREQRRTLLQMVG